MDRYTKIILTGILLVLISIAAKDVDLFPIAEAQQDWGIENDMNGSMQALPESYGLAYICRSNQMPVGGPYGDHGYLSVSFYDGAQCMGSQIGVAHMFSAGATHSFSDDRYLLSANQMHFYADATARAADTGQRVAFYSCDGNNSPCLRNIQFRGDPSDIQETDENGNTD